MEAYEREYTESLVANHAASIAHDVRDLVDSDQFVGDDGGLTEKGRMYVRGYVVGRLCVLRTNEGTNPNLTDEDMAELVEIIDRKESAIAAELHA